LSLKSKVEIDQLFKNGRKLSGDYFTLLWERSESFKYGVFVAKAAGDAPTRNRIKRLSREAIRLNRKKLTFPVTLVLLPRKRAPIPEFEDIDAEIGRLFDLIKA
jgi:ribonuclease P protein component